MNIIIDHEVLLDALTYNHLFDYVDVPYDFAAALEKSYEQHYKLLAAEGCLIDHVTPYHIEKTDHHPGYRIWYPIRSWIDECKRRSGMEQAISQERERVQANKSVADQIQQLNQQLIAVFREGNKEKINELADKIRELQKKL